MSFLLKKDDSLGQKTELSTTSIMNRKDTTSSNIISSSTITTANNTINAAAAAASSTTEKEYCSQNLEIVFKNIVVDNDNEIISICSNTNVDGNVMDANRMATEKSNNDNMVKVVFIQYLLFFFFKSFIYIF